MSTLTFFVPGRAMPAGSKSAFRTGKRTIVTDSSGEKGKTWRATVQSIASQRFNEPLWDGPLRVRFVYLVDRPRGHFGTGKNAGILKASAPKYPTTRPDLLKLSRAVEDALTDVIWKDDSQIVIEILYKFFVQPEDGEKPGVYITVGKVMDGKAAEEYRHKTRRVSDGDTARISDGGRGG